MEVERGVPSNWSHMWEVEELPSIEHEEELGNCMVLVVTGVEGQRPG